MPWPYFHLVSVLQIFVLSILGMAIVGFAHPVVTIIVHAMNCLVFLGLKELACVMSDPFGDDVIDFKVDNFLRASYINAVSHLAEDRTVTGPNFPQGISLPMIGEQKPRNNLSKTTATRILEKIGGKTVRRPEGESPKPKPKATPNEAKEEAAAVKLQASVRGHAARVAHGARRVSHDSAVKLQARFRGHSARAARDSKEAPQWLQALAPGEWIEYCAPPSPPPARTVPPPARA